MQNDFKIIDGYVVTSKKLGEGAFGVVYRGYLEKDPKYLVAVKVLPLSEAHKNKNFTKLLKREISILSSIESANIVKLLHAARTANNYYIFLEYCNGGDLRQLLKARGGQLSQQEALTYFRHIVFGFKGIYQQSVIHRDIKPANIILHDGIAKISDFGFARVVDDMEDRDHFTLLGTPLYMAPQILKSDKFSSKCDIWSLGMMFYEMLYGYTPWTAHDQISLANQIKTKPLTFPDKPKRLQIVKDLISKMLIQDEEQRIGWYEIFDHELIKFDDQELRQKMTVITDSTGDLLEQSIQMNQLYIDHNKVLAKGKIGDAQNVFVTKAQQEGESPDSIRQSGNSNEQYIKPGMTYNEIVEAQSIKLKEIETINKIDQQLTLLRNIGIFVNLTTNNIFALYREKVLSIPQHLFYRTIFLLQKHQMIIFEELTHIMASKTPIGYGFSDADWKLFKNSQQYFTTLHAIKADKYYIKPYYSEITKRTTSYLESQMNTLSPQDLKEVKEFQSAMAQGLVREMAFNTVYSYCISKVIAMLAEELAKNDPLRENKMLLQTFKYLTLCQDPFKYFITKNYGDFNKFYELYDNMEVEVLWKEITETALIP